MLRNEREFQESEIRPERKINKKSYEPRKKAKNRKNGKSQGKNQNLILNIYTYVLGIADEKCIGQNAVCRHNLEQGP